MADTRSYEVGASLRGLSGYAAFNYGGQADVTRACEAGDAGAFMAAARALGVSQSTDIRLAGMQDRINQAVRP